MERWSVAVLRRALRALAGDREFSGMTMTDRLAMAREALDLTATMAPSIFGMDLDRETAEALREAEVAATATAPDIVRARLRLECVSMALQLMQGPETDVLGIAKVLADFAMGREVVAPPEAPVDAAQREINKRSSRMGGEGLYPFGRKRGLVFDKAGIFHDAAKVEPDPQPAEAATKAAQESADAGVTVASDLERMKDLLAQPDKTGLAAVAAVGSYLHKHFGTPPSAFTRHRVFLAGDDPLSAAHELLPAGWRCTIERAWTGWRCRVWREEGDEPTICDSRRPATAVAHAALEAWKIEKERTAAR